MQTRRQLKRELSPSQAGSMALGCIIGFGCFVLPGDFLERSGPMGATVGIILGGIVVIIIARAYGVMVRNFTVAGAEFAYAYYAFGRYHAYVCGWFLAVGYISIVPLNATALTIMGRFLSPDLFTQGYLYSVAGFDVFFYEVLLASIPIVFIGYLNYKGIKAVGRVQVVMTVVLVGAVIVIGIGGLLSPTSTPENLHPLFPISQSPLSAILAMLAITPWLYVGFDTIPQAAEEFNFSPSRVSNLMVLAIVSGVLMYTTVVVATGMVFPWRELISSGYVWATGTTVSVSLGFVGVIFLVVAVSMAIFTGINGFYVATSRLLFSMARGKILPNWFVDVHPTYGTPHHAVIFTGLMSLLAPWFGRQVILWVIDMAALGTVFGYGYTCLAAYWLISQSPHCGSNRERWYALLGALLSMGCFVLLCVPGMPGFMAGPSWIALTIWAIVGVLFYLLRTKEYDRLSQNELDYLILGQEREKIILR